MAQKKISNAYTRKSHIICSPGSRSGLQHCQRVFVEHRIPQIYRPFSVAEEVSRILRVSAIASRLVNLIFTNLEVSRHLANYKFMIHSIFHTEF